MTRITHALALPAALAIIALAIAAGPGATPAMAQAATDTAAADTTAEAPAASTTPAADTVPGRVGMDPIALPGLVVTATRVPLDRRAVPTPVTIITGDELRRRGVTTVAEALRETPGAMVVTAGPPGAQTSLFIRGGESDYVKVLVDGVPVNDPGGALDLAGLSTDQVERIEVVRGPVSVLYGSDAVSGVVQIFTRRGSGAPAVEARVTGGSGRQTHDGDRYGTYDASASVSGSIAALSYAVGGGRLWSEGLYPQNSERALNTADVRLGWSPAAGPEVALTSRLADGRSHFPTDGAGNLVDANAFIDRRLHITSLDAGWRVHDRVDTRLRLGLVAREQASIDAQDGPDDLAGVYASTLTADVTRRLADGRVDLHLPRTIATVGVAWEVAKGASSYTAESDFGPTDVSARYDRATTGYYAQILASPIDPVHLTLSGRLDDSETYGTFETYRVGAVVRVLDGTRLRCAAGRGFREPSFSESFGSGFGDRGNAALQPERSTSWELGLEQEVGPLTVAGTWFDQTFEDMIQFTFAPPEPDDPNYVNVGAARARGLELEVGGAWGHWSATASYSRLQTEVLDPGLATDATFVEGEALLRRPAHSGTVTGRYASGRGSVALFLNAIGERADVDFGAGFPAPRITLPAVATVDLAAEYRLPVPGPSTHLLFRVENLLDEGYDAIAGFPAPRRLVRLGVRVDTR